ncbi:hypothetical protein AUEXF2481DRAFT_600646 [Aureobasidium subglaciale EXF-2481]|uniref:Uncharacterized protein n=1 Tax=Aureobasidium subglaciale (strain EXF-2481) TaxID=1043005 RepID=A0A074YTJ5_AURSE|nr:uncharacterized protein AUEXF2481DRAFT_600646 [Aureobasidium subglaciale EXF-2481]KEQ97462.1 hypothetical protein AUEXF2481DRAFT_600646 [Aureobasidium subglaciale EXF-2481]
MYISIPPSILSATSSPHHLSIIPIILIILIPNPKPKKKIKTQYLASSIFYDKHQAKPSKMCFRLISTFTRCGHQDTLAHLKLCSSSLSTWPSIPCPLDRSQLDTPLYDINAFCPSCTITRTFVAATGFLAEVSGDNGVVTRRAGAVVEDIGAKRETTDRALEWKELGVMVGGGGWDGVGTDAATGGEWGAIAPVADNLSKGKVSPTNSGVEERMGDKEESWADASERQAQELGGQETAMQW